MGHTVAHVNGYRAGMIFHGAGQSVTEQVYADFLYAF